MNRKLIRPDFSEIKEKIGRSPKTQSQAESLGQTAAKAVDPGAAAVQASASPRRKIAPPEQTNAESFYYLKQMQTKTPMVIVLQNDEKLRGVIEWYDKHCIKINRIKEPNLLVPKHNIKYIYKQDEEPRIRRNRTTKKDEAAPVQDVDLPLYD